MAIYFGTEKVAGNFLENKSVMTLYKSSRFSLNLPTQYTAVALPLTEYTVCGDKLTYSNNSVKIGKGVSKVLASASMGMWNSPSAGEVGLQIYRNDKRVGMAFGNHGGGIWGMSIPPVLVDVTEGDLLKLMISSSGTGTHNFLTDDKAVNLTVQVVE